MVDYVFVNTHLGADTPLALCVFICCVYVYICVYMFARIDHINKSVQLIHGWTASILSRGTSRICDVFVRTYHYHFLFYVHLLSFTQPQSWNFICFFSHTTLTLYHKPLHIILLVVLYFPTQKVDRIHPAGMASERAVSLQGLRRHRNVTFCVRSGRSTEGWRRGHSLRLQRSAKTVQKNTQACSIVPKGRRHHFLLCLQWKKGKKMLGRCKGCIKPWGFDDHFFQKYIPS